MLNEIKGFLYLAMLQLLRVDLKRQGLLKTNDTCDRYKNLTHHQVNCVEEYEKMIDETSSLVAWIKFEAKKEKANIATNLVNNRHSNVLNNNYSISKDIIIKLQNLVDEILKEENNIYYKIS